MEKHFYVGSIFSVYAVATLILEVYIKSLFLIVPRTLEAKRSIYHEHS